MRGMRGREQSPFRDKSGNFFLALSIIMLFLALLPVLSTIGRIFFYLFAGLAIVASFGLVLLNTNFKEFVSNGGELFKSVGELIKYSSFLWAAASVLALIATVLYAKSAVRFDKGRRVFTGIVFIVLPLVFIVLLQIIHKHGYIIVAQ